MPVTEAPVDKVAVVVLDGVKVGEAVTLEEGVTAPEFVVDMVALVVMVIVLLGVTGGVFDVVAAAVRDAVSVAVEEGVAVWLELAVNVSVEDGVVVGTAVRVEIADLEDDDEPVLVLVTEAVIDAVTVGLAV